MSGLYVANILMNENEGIYKKVRAQTNALGLKTGGCDLVTNQKGLARVTLYGQTTGETKNEGFFKYIDGRIKAGEISILYIRHMIPCFALIRTLKLAKKHGVPTYYEIPTYPYFAEQFRVSRRKYRAIAKIILEVLFWPSIYRHISKLVVIRSNTETRLYPKMVEIINGVNIDNLRHKTYTEKPDKVFRMVAVGTLYPYHGYDRVLAGMAACGETVGDNIPVELHIIGSSDTIQDLERASEGLGLKRVFFYGTKTTEELNDLYEGFDVGLGCLALHRRNANIDTTLKIVEYYCRGVPTITSGISPMDRFNTDVTIHVEDGEEPLDIRAIYESYRKIDRVKIRTLADEAGRVFSWNQIMARLLKGEN